MESDAYEEGIRTVRMAHRPLVFSKTLFLTYLWSVMQGFRYLVRSGFCPDILHGHVYYAGVAAVLLGKAKHIPVVITEHWSGFPRRLLGPFGKLFAWYAFTRADRVCPVSENLRESIESYGIDARYQVVPNPVVTSVFYPGSPKEPWQDQKKHMLFVGMLLPVKGLPTLLEAIRQLKQSRTDFVLDIVGDGPKRAEYERLSEELGLGDTVKFHGRKPLSDVAEYLQRVLSSRHMISSHRGFRPWLREKVYRSC